MSVYIEAGDLVAQHLLTDVRVRGVQGTLREVSYRKAIGRDEIEVRLYIVGDGWNVALGVEPTEPVEFVSTT